MMGVGTCITLAPFTVRRMAALRAEWRDGSRHVLGAAVLASAAYVLVLFAFRLSHAGYVVAARGLSILFSVVLGRFFLDESPLGPRLWRASLIAAGVALIVVRA